MNLEVKKLLQDIYDSIILIESHLHDIPSLSIYSKDQKTIDAIERRLSIIGEALWKADKRDNTLIVSDKMKTIILRHILVHDYDLTDDSTIWMICKKYIPVLKDEVLLILNSN